MCLGSEGTGVKLKRRWYARRTNRILKCFGTRLKAGLYWIEEGMAPMRKYGVHEKSGTQSLRVQIPELTKPSLFTRGFLEVAGGGSDSSSPESLSGAPLFREAGVVCLGCQLDGIEESPWK